MNNDIEKNVLQYSDELQKMTQETEQNLLKIQNDKLKEFKNNVNNISNNCIADIQLLINQTHSKVASNLARNKIDEDILDEFRFNVQAILLQAKNDLGTYKNQFDLDISDAINEETMKLKNFIKENHGKIESELHDALYQINQSENSALRRLEETYDLGVETIVSAEKTALKNLKLLFENLSIKLEDKVELIENVINEKIQNAIDSIKSLEDEVIANIAKLEISIKNSLQVEKENIIAEINNIISDLKFTLQGFVEEMKAELTAHKNKLLEEINIGKEEVFIELDRTKTEIIGALKEKEYEIIQILNNSVQGLISDLISVVEGFDLELEKIKNAKIKEFTDAINSIKTQLFNEILTTVDDCLLQLQNSANEYKSELFNETAKHLINLKNKYEALAALLDTNKDKAIVEIDKKKTEVVEELVNYSKEEINKYITNVSEQRYSCVLPANETFIQLPKTFVLNDRVKIYIDGLLHLPDGFFTIDKLNRTITLLKSYSYPTNIFVTADLPDVNLQALKDQLYIDGNKYVSDSLNEIRNESNIQKENIRDFVNELNQSSRNDINEFKENCKTELNEETNNLIENSKFQINSYIENFSEGYFNTNLNANEVNIVVPKDSLVLNSKAKVYIDGILQIKNKHYEIDVANNLIKLKESFSYETEILILQSLPTTDSTFILATDEQINALF